MFDRRLVQNFDWILLFLLILIVTISLTNLYSATYPIRDAGGDKIFSKQVYWFLMGFVVLFMVTFFDYHLLERGGYSIYAFSIILLIMVLIIGRVHSGSQRWLGVGSFVFQPSEVAKISMVIVLAKFFTNNSEFSDYRLRDLADSKGAGSGERPAPRYHLIFYYAFYEDQVEIPFYTCLHITYSGISIMAFCP